MRQTHTRLPAGRPECRVGRGICHRSINNPTRHSASGVGADPSCLVVGRRVWRRGQPVFRAGVAESSARRVSDAGCLGEMVKCGESPLTLYPQKKKIPTSIFIFRREGEKSPPSHFTISPLVSWPHDDCAGLAVRRRLSTCTRTATDAGGLGVVHQYRRGQLRRAPCRSPAHDKLVIQRRTRSAVIAPTT